MAFNIPKMVVPLSVNDPLQKTPVVREGNLKQPDLVANNQQMPNGYRTRQLIVWRVPSIGFVKMYINPQQMVITEKKAITKQRTKGGFIVQYWGEELTTIRLEGNTGSSGIEGINILRKVYRAEQDAFQKVAQQMADRAHSYSASSLGANLMSPTTSIGAKIGNMVSGLLGGATSSPLLPTLGSLAMSVEMFYQGVVYKGIFEDFTITEGVTQGVGIFTYTLTFTVLDRRGSRVNFAEWHRSPAVVDPQTGSPIHYYQADSNSVPLSFKDEG